MFNIGGPEVLVIALIALVVVGPEQLPSVLRKLGKQAAQLRAMTQSVRDEFMSEIDEVNPVNWMKDTSDVPKNPTSVAELDEQMDAAEKEAEEQAMGKAAADEQEAKFAAKAEETMAQRRADPAQAGQRAEAEMSKPLAEPDASKPLAEPKISTPENDIPENDIPESDTNPGVSE